MANQALLTDDGLIEMAEHIPAVCLLMLKSLNAVDSYFKSPDTGLSDFHVCEIPEVFLALFTRNLGMSRVNYNTVWFTENKHYITLNFPSGDSIRLQHHAKNAPLFGLPGMQSKSVHLIFNDRFLSYHQQLPAVFNDVFKYGSNQGRIALMAGTTDSLHLMDILSEILRESRSPSKEMCYLISSYFYLFFSRVRKLFKNMAGSADQSPPSFGYNRVSLNERYVQAINKYISTNPVNYQARSVRFYANLLLVHPNHLNAVVKKATREPAIALIHKEIVLVAKMMLADPSVSIKEIAYHLAFKEPSHFNTFFRKHTNLTPTTFREMIDSQVLSA